MVTSHLGPVDTHATTFSPARLWQCRKRIALASCRLVPADETPRLIAVHLDAVSTRSTPLYADNLAEQHVLLVHTTTLARPATTIGSRSHSSRFYKRSWGPAPCKCDQTRSIMTVMGSFIGRGIIISWISRARRLRLSCAACTWPGPDLMSGPMRWYTARERPVAGGALFVLNARSLEVRLLFKSWISHKAIGWLHLFAILDLNMDPS